MDIPDFDIDNDIAEEYLLREEEAPSEPSTFRPTFSEFDEDEAALLACDAPPPSSEKEKKIAVDPGHETLDACLVDAKKQNHSFVFKVDDRYHSCVDAKAFYGGEFKTHPNVFEVIQDDRPVMFYLHVRRELVREPIDLDKTLMALSAGWALSGVLGYSVEQVKICHTFDQSHGNHLALRLVFPRIKCANIAQAENLMNMVNDAAKGEEYYKRPGWRPTGGAYKFPEAVPSDKSWPVGSSCYFDPNFYAKNQLLAMPTPLLMKRTVRECVELCVTHVAYEDLYEVDSEKVSLFRAGSPCKIIQVGPTVKGPIADAPKEKEKKSARSRVKRKRLEIEPEPQPEVKKSRKKKRAEIKKVKKKVKKIVKELKKKKCGEFDVDVVVEREVEVEEKEVEPTLFEKRVAKGMDPAEAKELQKKEETKAELRVTEEKQKVLEVVHTAEEKRQIDQFRLAATQAVQKAGIAKQERMLELCLQVIRAKFPKGDLFSKISEVDRNRFYSIEATGPRECPFGFQHTNVTNGWLRIITTPEAGFEYGCNAKKCKGLKHFYRCPELAEFTKGPRCLPPGALDQFDQLDGHVFNVIDKYFYGLLEKKGYVDGQEITDQEEVEWFQALRDAWREDNNKVINHFTRKVRKAGNMLDLTWTYSPFGFRQREVTYVNDPISMKNRWGAIKLTVCSLKREKKKKNPTTTFHVTRTSLHLHLTNFSLPDCMEDTEKIFVEGAEFYPALPDDDTRPECEKSRYLNAFGGLDLPPRFAIEWFDGLSAAKQAKVRDQMKFVDDHLQQVLAGGIKDDFEFFVNMLALKYQKPWIKADTNVVIRGPQGAGKTLILNDMMGKLFGPRYALPITNIKHLDDTFNGFLRYGLWLICEELVSPNSHNYDNFLKSHFDSTTLHRVSEKYLPVVFAKFFFNGIFLTNSEWSQNVACGERRWYCMLCAIEWIVQVCQERGWKQADYFDHLASIDPRVLGYYLATRDISNFNCRKERKVTHDTAFQELKSLHTRDLHMAFWAKVISNEIHHFVKPDKSRLPLILNKLNTWKNDMKRKMHVLSGMTVNETFLTNFDKSMQALTDIMYTEVHVPKFLSFALKKKDGKQVLAFLKQAMESKLPEAKLVSITEACDHLEEALKKKTFLLEPTMVKKIKHLLPRSERARYMTCTPLTKEELYQSYVVPFQSSEKIYDRSSRFDSTAFWKSTKRLGEGILIRASGKNRLFRLSSLKDLQDAFAKNILHREGFFD